MRDIAACKARRLKTSEDQAKASRNESSVAQKILKELVTTVEGLRLEMEQVKKGTEARMKLLNQTIHRRVTLKIRL